MAAAVSPAAPGAPVVLQDLGRVEAELARLWQANVAAGGDAEARPVLRAASFNLVTLVPSEEDTARVAAELAAITVARPGRVLIVWLDAAPGEDRLEAWVSMHCRAVGDRSQVCGEQIMVAAHGDAVDRVGGALGALLVPECPVLAWWRGGAGPGGAVLERLASLADAVLLDGGRFDPAGLRDWTARAASGAAARPVGDLAWLRGAPWRRWTADCFEPAALRPELDVLTRVRLEHGPGAAMDALLHVAWLGARLGWAPAPGLGLTAGGGWAGRLGAVAVEVAPVAAPAGLARVELEAASVGLRSVVAREGRETVLREVTRGEAVLERQLVRQREPDEATLVGRWLDDHRGDPLYGQVLPHLARITTGGGAP
jgi:glucose-6-phosphate dehydrogenase assembly protein OpcA